jgi:hypothetical protein
MIKKILMIFVLLMCLGGLFATTNDTEAYWAMEDLTDSSGNGYTLTNYGADSTIGKIDNGFDFVPSNNDYIKTGVTPSTDFSWSGWVDLQTASIAHEGIFTTITKGTGRNGLTLVDSGSGALALLGYVGNSFLGQIYSGSYGSGFVHIVVTWDGSTDEAEIFLNGVSSNSGTISGVSRLENDFVLGRKYATESTTSFDGSIDEVSIYNRILTSDEVLELYNSGTGYNPYVIVSSIQTNLQEYYNNTNILINLNSTDVGNFSYKLNGGTDTTIENNVNETSLNITLSEGNNSFEWFFDGENLLNESTIIDVTSPNISIIGNLTQTAFEVDFSTIFNVTDTLSGLASCTLNATYLENVTNASQYDKFVNCTDTTSFGAAGLYNGFIEAVDNAGNVATLSVNGIIQPFVYINFKFENGTSVSQYNGEIIHPGGEVETFTDTDNPLPISPYFDGSLDLGVYNVTFQKLGITTATFQINITETSGGTETNFTVRTAVINIEIRDKNTLGLITGTNFSLEFVASVGAVTSTTTGLVSLSNLLFQNEQYTLIVSSEDYSTETAFFDFNNQENKTITIYMINKTQTNLGFVRINVLNTFGQAISGAIVQALQWDSTTSSYIKVSESKTSEDGVGLLNIILDDKYYIFSAYTTTENSINSTDQIIATAQNGKNIFLTLQDATTQERGLIQGLTTNITESFNNATNISTVAFEWINIYGGNIESCINAYRLGVTGEKSLLSENCGAPSSSGTLIKSFYINSTYDVLISAEVRLEDGGYLTIKSFLHYSSLSLPTLITEYGLQYFILMIVFIIGIFIIVEHSVQVGTIILMISSGLSMFLIPTILSKSVMAFIMFICLAIIIGSTRGDK